MDKDLQFAHRYDVDEIPELPGSGPLRMPVHEFFPRGQRLQGGLWVHVKPEDTPPWIGIFSEEYRVPPAVTWVGGTPDQLRICVVAAGAAYIVHSTDPSQWELLSLFPVTQVWPAPQQNCLLFGGFTNVLAYGPAGVIWQSDRVCWDELKIRRVNEDRIEGTGYDPTDPSGSSRFVLEMRTGRTVRTTFI